MRNAPTLASLDTLSSGELAGMPAGILAELQDEVDAALELAKARRAALDAGLEQRYGQVAQEARLRQGKDTGVVRLPDGGLEVVVEAKKAVSWDQPLLTQIYRRILAAGDNPVLYMQTTYKVRENTYKDWPANIKAEFEPARTVRVGKSSYRIERDPAQKAVA